MLENILEWCDFNKIIGIFFPCLFLCKTELFLLGVKVMYFDVVMVWFDMNDKKFGIVGFCSY